MQHNDRWRFEGSWGRRPVFNLEDIWTLRVRLKMEGRVREVALFSLGVSTASCADALHVRGVCQGDHEATRAVVMATVGS